MILLISTLLVGFSWIPAEIKDGDIIFHRSNSRQAKAISLATHSDYTHIGIIFIEDGKAYVYKAVQPVKRTPIKDWIQRGRNHRYVIKRLKNANSILTGERIRKLKKISTSFLGKDYDWQFGWSDKRIYCSELVWKAYQRASGIEIGPLKKLKEFDLSSAEVKKIMKQRYGKNIPLNETVISPADIFNSPKLMTIISR